MTIQQMQYILEIHRAGSISKAANKLFISQPNLSNAVRALEQELGFTIFDRTHKGICATAHGTIVLEQAGEILLHYETILKACEQTNMTKIKVGGIPYSPICEAYNALCLEYQSQEHLHFTYSLMRNAAIVEQLYLSMLDVGILMVRPGKFKELSKNADLKGLKISVVAKVPLTLRIGPNHPLYHSPEIKLSDFQNYTFVDYAGGPFSQNEEMHTYLTVNTDRVIMLADRESKNIFLSKSSTAYSVGGKLPPHLNQRYGYRNIPIGDLHFIVIFLTRKTQKMTPEMARFLELIKKELENL